MIIPPLSLLKDYYNTPGVSYTSLFVIYENILAYISILSLYLQFDCIYFYTPHQNIIILFETPLQQGRKRF